MIKSKGVTLLKQALKWYEVEGGAEGDSIYRDALTDLLHLYNEDPRIHQHEKNIDSLLSLAHGNFLCEREEEEIAFIQSIKTNALPLYLSKTWEFPSSLDYFRERIRNELGDAKNSAAPANRSKAAGS